MTFPNLKAEMTRHGITVSELAAVWNTTERTVTNRLNGTTEITFAQCRAARDSLFPGMTIDYLFNTEPIANHDAC